MEKLLAVSVEELYKKVIEHEERLKEIESEIGIKYQEETSS